METVSELIKLRRGDLASLQQNYLRVVNPGWMPLTVEVVQAFANGAYEVSVCHYGEQNGDAMRDPEMTFFVTTAGAWQPLYYRNDYVGVEHWCASVSPEGVAVVTNAKLERELVEFARLWDANIKQQGFLDVVG